MKLFAKKQDPDVLYRVHGNEREHLATMIRDLVAQEQAVVGLVRFIAQREGVQDDALWDRQRMAFLKPPTSGP